MCGWSRARVPPATLNWSYYSGFSDTPRLRRGHGDAVRKRVLCLSRRVPLPSWEVAVVVRSRAGPASQWRLSYKRSLTCGSRRCRLQVYGSAKQEPGSP